MIFCALSHIYGQATKIKGFVIDKDTEAAVDGVIIQVKDKAGKNLAYTFSDDNGSFSIDFDASCSASVIVFHLMGYAEKRIRISDIKSPVRVYLESQHTQLDDVIVTAPDIEQRSDTLVYYLSHYAKESDRNIADVLKRLPGIKVEESGEIKYNGEPINKFYIDGADFADGSMVWLPRIYFRLMWQVWRLWKTISPFRLCKVLNFHSRQVLISNFVNRLDTDGLLYWMEGSVCRQFCIMHLLLPCAFQGNGRTWKPFG